VPTPAEAASAGSLSASEQADLRALYRDLVRREQERQEQRKERKRKWVWEDERLQRKRHATPHPTAVTTPGQQQQDAGASASATDPEIKEDAVTGPSETGASAAAPDGEPPSTASALTAAAEAAASGSLMIDIGAGLQFMRDKKGGAVGVEERKAEAGEQRGGPVEDDEEEEEEEMMREPSPADLSLTAQRETQEGEERRRRQNRQEQLAQYQATVRSYMSGPERLSQQGLALTLSAVCVCAWDEWGI
jgi:hypothetical protein